MNYCHAPNSGGWCQSTVPCPLGECKYRGLYQPIFTNTTAPKDQECPTCGGTGRVPPYLRCARGDEGESVFLTADDLIELTGYKRASLQVAWLRKAGVRHYLRKERFSAGNQREPGGILDTYNRTEARRSERSRSALDETKARRTGYTGGRTPPPLFHGQAPDLLEAPCTSG